MRRSLLSLATILLMATALPADAKKPSKKDIADCQSQDAQVALAACTSIIDNPATKTSADLWAHYNRGHAYFVLKDYDKSVADFTLILAEGGKKGAKVPFRKGDALLERGRALLAAGKFAEAEPDLQQATKEIGTEPEPFRLHGFALNQLGRYEEAEDQLRWAAAIAPDNAQVQSEYGRALTYVGKYEEAHSAYGAAIAANGGSWPLGNRAFNFLIQRKYDEAIADIDSYLAKEPGNSWALQFRARARAFKGELDAAAQDIDASLAAQPENGDALYVKGYILARKMKFAEAKPVLEKVLALDATNSEAMIALGDVAVDEKNDEAAAQWYGKVAATPKGTAFANSLHALAAEKLAAARARIERPALLLTACETQSAVEAVTACTELLQIAKTDDQRMRARMKRVALSTELRTVEEDAAEILKQEPANRAALLSRATLRAASPGQEEGALKDYRELLSANAKDIEALVGRASLYSRLGRYSEMGADAGGILAIDPSSADGLKYGIEAAIAAKNLPRLEELAGKAALTYPGQPFGFTGLAAAKLGAGDNAGAIEDSSRAIEISGGDPEAYLVRGIALLATGKADEASDDLSRALAIAPGRIDILMPRAEAFLAAGNYGRALDDAEGVLKMAPDTLRAREIRALALLGRGMTGPALAEATDILAIAPGNEAMLMLRAEAKMASGDFEAAAREAAVAADKVPTSAKAHALLSLALYRASKLGEAKGAIAKAISLDPATLDYRIAQARILSEMGDHAEALKVADEILVKWPRNPIMHAVRGAALAADGKASLALEAYETALKIEPRYMRVFKLTGDLYASIGTNDLALQFYTKALDAVPQDEIETRIQAEAKEARSALIDRLSKASGGG